MSEAPIYSTEAADTLSMMRCNEQCNTEGANSATKASYAMALRRLETLAGPLVDSDRQAITNAYRYGIKHF